ncbi:hypothetical protein G9U52_27405 [Paenibacillus sp. S3N08]|uniref:Cyanophage baseplate Pam3 plug gp18 domain-containing protein n=1 Tax=Paenibacillus agricola TaxID=2716264 RepID=A0ABX0JC68_9BACL|nr:hypothetical protein [Paenibacillus agricola]
MVPLVPGRNQSFTCTLPIDSKNVTLAFTFTYNRIGEYWFMSITDSRSNTLLLDAVPLVTGLFPAEDLLGQYTYLGIGSASIVPVSSLSEADIPNEWNLGTDYVLVWGDTIG